MTPIRGRKALIEFGWNLTNVRNENGGAYHNRDGTWSKPPWPPPVVAQLLPTDGPHACYKANVSVYSFSTSPSDSVVWVTSLIAQPRPGAIAVRF